MAEFLQQINRIPEETSVPVIILPKCPEWRLNKVENSKMVNYELMVLYNTAGYLINCIIKNKFKICDL